MDRRGYELDTIPPYDVLDVVRISPEGVEGAGRVGRHIGVITEEGAAEMVAGVNGVQLMRPSGGGGPAKQVCNGET